MKSGDVFITDEFISKNRKAIKAAIDFETYARFSPRRILVEKAREEFRYSDTTLAQDIWHAIIRKYTP